MTALELNQLYQSYGPAVRARCRSICGNHADADEALQETFVKAWRKRSRFDGRHPLAWLMTIARNTSLDVLRRRRADVTKSIGARRCDWDSCLD